MTSQLAMALLPALCAARERAWRVEEPRVVAASLPVACPDPFAIFARAEEVEEPRFFAACGAQLRVGIGEVAALRAPEREPTPGAGIGAVAAQARALLTGADVAAHADLLLLGGFAFEARAPDERDPVWQGFGAGRLTLPELTLVASPDGARLSWAARVAPDDDPEALAGEIAARAAQLLAAPGAPADAPRIEAPPDALADRYARAAEAVIEAIRSGAAQKVVLAEFESLRLNGRLDAPRVLRALCAAHPRCLCFAQGLGAATFLGATPERMVSLCDGRVRAAALAGTAPLGADLRASPKDRDEHGFVVAAIAEALRSSCSEVEVPSAPAILCTGKVVHLETQLTARARPGLDVLDLVSRLHPTPAVAGTPRPAALELIRKHERFDRGWYAGPIGWVDARGNGEFHVALRCGLLRPGELRIFAGAGLVAASDPRREAAETRLKLGALRDPLEAACAP